MFYVTDLDFAIFYMACPACSQLHSSVIFYGLELSYVTVEPVMSDHPLRAELQSFKAGGPGWGFAWFYEQLGSEG